MKWLLYVSKVAAKEQQAMRTFRSNHAVCDSESMVRASNVYGRRLGLRGRACIQALLRVRHCLLRLCMGRASKATSNQLDSISLL